MEIFSLIGKILLKDDGIEDKLDKIDKKASKTSVNMDEAFKGFGSTLLKIGGVLGIGLGLKGFIDDAGEAEAGVSQLNAVLKSTGGAVGMSADQITDMAGALQKVTKFSDDTILSGQNLLLTFTGIGKDVFPQTTETMLDMSQALGQDVKSSAIQLGKALNDPINGVTALSRVGVSFTEEQKKQIKVLQESGNVVGAQKIILAELNKEFGNSAKAAGETFTGKLERVKNQFGEVSEAIGGKLLPKLGDFLDFVMSNMPAIQGFISNAMDIVGAVFDRVSNIVTQVFIPAFKNIISAWQFIVDGFKGQGDPEALTGTIWKTFYEMGEKVKDSLNKVSDFIKTTVIPAFTTLYNWIAPYMPQIKQFVSEAFTKIKEVMKDVSDFVNTYVIPIYISLGKWFVENFPKIKAAVMEAFNYIKPKFEELVKTVKENLVPILQDLWKKVQEVMPSVQKIFEAVFPIVVWLLGQVITGIGDFIKIAKKIYDDIKPGIDLLIGLFKGVADIVEKAVNWLKSWNGTKAENKTATVNTNYVTSGKSSYGSGNGLPYNASGTDFFEGGLTNINEQGGEIIDLPRGSRVYPHDVSMEMAKNSGDNITNYYISDIKLPNVGNGQQFIDSLAALVRVR